MMQKRNRSIIFFIIIFLPIFIGYEYGRGFVTDANPFNLIAFPAFPVSTFLVLFGLIFSINKKNALNFLSLNLLFGLLSVLIFSYLDLFRQFSYNVAILLGSAAYYSGLRFNRRHTYKQIVHDLAIVLVAIISAKLCFDLLVDGIIYSDFFIAEDFKIYNAYDYFPVVYLLSGTLGILVIRDNPILGAIAMMISFLAIFTYSRFYAVSILLLYLFCFARFYKIKTFQLMSLLFLSLIVMTGVLAVFASSFNTDPSLSLRFSHWYHYFSTVNEFDVFIPVLNEYRVDLSWGGLHNELLEIYSYFGIFTVILGVIFTKLASNLDARSKVSMVPFLVILGLGMLIQNNFTQPYNTVIIFFLLGLFHKKSKYIKELSEGGI